MLTFLCYVFRFGAQNLPVMHRTGPHPASLVGVALVTVSGLAQAGLKLARLSLVEWAHWMKWMWLSC